MNLEKEEIQKLGIKHFPVDKNFYTGLDTHPYTLGRIRMLTEQINKCINNDDDLHSQNKCALLMKDRDFHWNVYIGTQLPSVVNGINSLDK